MKNRWLKTWALLLTAALLLGSLAGCGSSKQTTEAPAAEEATEAETAGNAEGEADAVAEEADAITEADATAEETETAAESEDTSAADAEDASAEEPADASEQEEEMASHPTETWDVSESEADHVTASLYEKGSGYVMVFSGQGRMKGFPAPEEIGQEVGTSTAPWASYAEQISEAVYEEGVTSIGARSMEGCVNMVRIRLGKDITEVGDFAFDLCNHLLEIYNESALNIDEVEGTLSWYKLVVYDDPEAESILVTEGDFVFAYYEEVGYLVNYTGSDEEVTIPASFTYEGKEIPVTETFQYSLYGCTTVKEFIFPEGLKVMGFGSMEKCTSLERVVVPDSVEGIGDYIFYGSNQIKEVQLGSGVKTIGSMAFLTTRVKELHIPASVETIGNMAFVGMSEPLETVWIDSEAVAASITDGNAAGMMCGGLATLYVKEGLTVTDYVRETFAESGTEEKDSVSYLVFRK